MVLRSHYRPTGKAFSRKEDTTVIPAHAGIQTIIVSTDSLLDCHLHGNDEYFLPSFPRMRESRPTDFGSTGIIFSRERPKSDRQSALTEGMWGKQSPFSQ